MLKPQANSRRRAFSIAEMVASVAILAILGAIVVPSVSRYLYQQKIEATAALFDSLSAARYAFQRALTVNPGHLSYLTRQPIALNTDEGACNGISSTRAFYTSGQTFFWSGSSTPIHGHSGPYFGRRIPETSFPVGIGFANNQMIRTSALGVAGFLMIVVPNVTYADALALDRYVDGQDVLMANRTDTAGAIRWTTTPSGTSDVVTLLWFMAYGTANPNPC